MSSLSIYFYVTIIMIFTYLIMLFKFFCLYYMSENSLSNKSIQHVLLFLYVMQTIFLQQDNGIFLPSVIINKITWFSCLVLYFDTYACLVFSVLWGTYKILRAIDLLFNSNFFQSFWCDGKLISFQLYWSIKSLIFYRLWESFSMFW